MIGIGSGCSILDVLRLSGRFEPCCFSSDRAGEQILNLQSLKICSQPLQRLASSKLRLVEDPTASQRHLPRTDLAIPETSDIKLLKLKMI